MFGSMFPGFMAEMFQDSMITKQTWQSIARCLANLLNTKQLTLEEAKRKGLMECVKLIDIAFGTTIRKMIQEQYFMFEQLEVNFNAWLEK